MTTRDDERAEPAEPAKGRTDAEGEAERKSRPPISNGGSVQTPDPEEVPELLGERSDYPIPRGEPS